MGKRLSRYRIDALLGQGGMGKVHRAFDTLLQREVAIKVLRTGSGPDAEASHARLLKEARFGAAFAHPNVVTIHDLGEEDGAAFIVMELAIGQTLRTVIRGRSGAIDFATKLRWLLEIASALEAAHAAGLVHRDIKPENVIITASRSVKILDFGIAKLHGKDPTSGPSAVGPRVLPTGAVAPPSEGAPSIAVVGTPAYMAPEQWTGVVDERVDQYAWGILAYELLSGRRPVLVVEGQPAQRQTLQSLSDLGLPPAIDVILARATAVTPAERFPSMSALLALWPTSSDRTFAETPATRLEVDTERRNETLEVAVVTTTRDSTLALPRRVTPSSTDVEHLPTIASPSGEQAIDPPLPARTWRRPSGLAVMIGMGVLGVALASMMAVQARSRFGVRPSRSASAAGATTAPLVAMTGELADVRVGSTTSCVLMPDRTVSCWGAGRAAPAPVEGLSEISSFSVGASHACALSAGRDRLRGDAYCWGANAEGQLGDGTTAGRDAARKVGLPAQATEVLAGPTHTCALVSTEPGSELYCWGANDRGQLGDGTTDRSLEPKRVAFAAGHHVLRFTVGSEVTCATLTPSDELLCWGRNDFGQAGQDPARIAAVTTPTVVRDVPATNGIFAGGRHVCARAATTREVWCWGANDHGQLGRGNVSVWERPAHVPGLQAIDTMRVGSNHACAILKERGRGAGVGRCWGSNEHGQLGLASVGLDQPSVIETEAIDKSPFDARSSDHACKVDVKTGLVSCWGRNDENQLGDGTRESRHVPVLVRP